MTYQGGGGGGKKFLLPLGDSNSRKDGRTRKKGSLLSLLSILLLSQDRYKYALPPPSAARQKREEDAHAETNSLPNNFPDFRSKMTRPNSPLAPSTSASWLLLATFASTLLAVALLGGDGCSAQTFHYSHGWTNGKRSGDSAVYFKDMKVTHATVVNSAGNMQEEEEFNRVSEKARIAAEMCCPLVQCRD